MTMKQIFLLCSLCVFLTPVTGSSETYSKLWGPKGEGWSAESRLPDFSFAGYQRGEKPIPEIAVTANVTDFGAVADDEGDDSQAFLKAIEETESGAILIPAGKYIITEILEIQKPNIVLRGEGPDQTILYFPKPMHEIRPNMSATTGGRPTSNYSWSGGFIWLRGNNQSTQLTYISGTAKRGAYSIKVESVDQLQPGQTIEIYQRDHEDDSLARHLYSEDAGNTDKINNRTSASLVTRITGIEGNTVTFDRPLRFDIEQHWNPQVRRFDPTVQEVGIEGIAFEFPVTPYKGHFTEWGNNGIAMSSVANCWARDITFINADSGVFGGGRFCTFQRLTYTSERPVDNQDCTGHHGVYISTDDNLFTEFDFQTRFIHDLTVSHCAGNVFSNGKGDDMCFDHHKRVPYENLFTSIDIGKGNRMWKCGGGADLGKHCAARGTFWNIKADQPQSYPRDNFGPWSMNLVAIETQAESDIDIAGKWFEAIPPGEINPQNIHEAQLKLRLNKSQ